MDTQLLFGKEIGIFGAGLHAQRCLYMLNENKLDICCYIDNNLAGKCFRGKKILEANQKNLKGKAIIVAVSEESYQSVRVQLMGYGLKEFSDFIYYKLLRHKTAIIYGNCHVAVMKEFLKSSRIFSSVYSFYPLPVVMDLNASMISNDVLSHCDLFLGQDIRENNPFGEVYSIKQIVSRLSRTCQILIIPNLYKLGTLYFPQYKRNFNNDNDDGFYQNGRWDRYGFFPFSDSIIDNLVKHGMNTREIISQCISGNNFSSREIEQCFESCIKKIRERERTWDIKCAEYIEKNYKSKRLFYEPEHPTNIMFEYICRNLLDLLGISDLIHTDVNLGYYETPIYPEVRNALDLTFDTEMVRFENDERRLDVICSHEEYIKQYLWWRSLQDLK